MNDTVSGATGASTLSGAQTEAASVESIVNEFLPLTAIGGPIGAGIAAGVTAAEGVTNTILASTANHAAPLAIAAGAAAALATNAAPVIAALPAEDQAKATAGLGLLSTILADLKGIFGL